MYTVHTINCVHTKDFPEVTVYNNTVHTIDCVHTNYVLEITVYTVQYVDKPIEYVHTKNI